MLAQLSGNQLTLVCALFPLQIADRALLSQLGLSQTEVEQPVREYKWGSAYALNREHSDLIMLKRLLLGDRVDSLYAMLDESYLKYVAFCEQYEEAGKQLPLVVQVSMAAAALHGGV